METAEQYADEVAGRAAGAAAFFRAFDQQQADNVAEAVFRAAFAARIDLARLAFEETQMGVLEHKAIKNAWASLSVYEDIRNRRTAGVIAADETSGITEIAQPRGAVLGTIPVTNPTSTTIFKALVCMKTRNPVIFSPHRGARRCVKETTRLLSEAATAAGAPPHAIQCITRGRTEFLEALMRHPKIALILATGTSPIVRMAQASGTPTLGVGPGNVPVYVHASADLAAAARGIVHSKTFDNGTICASEQALVVERDVAPALKPLLEARGAHFCSPSETRALGPVCWDSSQRRMRADVVGQPARVIAARAGFGVAEATRLLVAGLEGVGAAHPLSHEILAPVLALYVCDDYENAVATCQAVTALGGVGHTVAVWASDESVISRFAQMNAARILVNQPSTDAALGGICNALRPSLTLACGTGARNLSTDNITTDHLLNIHRLVRARPNRRWTETPRGKWSDPATGPGQVAG
jgi:acetaldehyde dehydrogenase/alcohol dehydrogenase